MAPLLLTDDEILAVSARVDVPWRTWIPTVPVEVEEGVLAAVARGSRSLFVRGLLDAESDQVDVSVVNVFQSIGERPVALAALACDANGGVIEGTPGQYFFGFAFEDWWLCDSISAGGVHTIERYPRTTATSDALAAVEAVQRHGTGVPGSPEAAFVLFAQRAGEVRRVTVRQGQAKFDRVVGGVVEHPVSAGHSTPSDAVRWLTQTGSD